MYDCVHLANSYIEFTKVNKTSQFIKKLNEINNFLNFFDKFEIDNKIKKNDRYELTYDPNLSYSALIQLVNDIISLCKKYKCKLNLKIIIFDDGQILLYLFVIDNKIFDISNDINNNIASFINNKMSKFLEK